MGYCWILFLLGWMLSWIACHNCQVNDIKRVWIGDLGRINGRRLGYRNICIFSGGLLIQELYLTCVFFLFSLPRYSEFSCQTYIPFNYVAFHTRSVPSPQKARRVALSNWYFDSPCKTLSNFHWHGTTNYDVKLAEKYFLTFITSGLFE